MQLRMRSEKFRLQSEQMTILDALGLRAPKDFAAPPGGAGVRKLLPWPPGQ